MPSTYTLISSNVLSSSAASVTFSAIPSTYTDLVLRLSVRGNDFAQTTEALNLTFNGDTASNYSLTRLNSSSGTPQSGRSTSANLLSSFRSMNGSTATANTFANTEIYIPSYTASQSKPLGVSAAPESNDTTSFNNVAVAGLWRNTAAITTILIAPNNSTQFVSGSSFYLYGIKNS